MKIIPATAFTRSVWKNGGGITHEIARDTPDENFGWRISIAEVGSDGPFSLFPGYQRCLTIIAGNGMELRRSSNSIRAELHSPVWFSGNEAITGHLLDGPCLDFNVIFDAARFEASLEILDGAEQTICGKKETLTALYQLHLSPSQKLNDIILLEKPCDQLLVPNGAKAIVLRLTTQTIRMPYAKGSTET